MNVKHWGARVALGAIFFAAALACRTTDVLVSELQPTATLTRTPRPTFTPVPPPIIPTAVPPTLAPTPVPPTRTPTRVPTRVPTKPPPTKPPVAPPPPPGPTTSAFEYHANPPGCEHSGITHIKARVYGDKNDPNSGVEGMKVALGAGDGINQYVPAVTTSWDGTYTFILSDPGPGRVGTWYVWLVDGKGNRISDVGGPVNTNNLGPDAPGTCWHGWVDFYK